MTPNRQVLEDRMQALETLVDSQIQHIERCQRAGHVDTTASTKKMLQTIGEGIREIGTIYSHLKKYPLHAERHAEDCPCTCEPLSENN